jgi:hypothetical protein
MKVEFRAKPLLAPGDISVVSLSYEDFEQFLGRIRQES